MKRLLIIWLTLIFFPFIRLYAQSCSGPVSWLQGEKTSLNALEAGESGSFSFMAGDLKVFTIARFTYNLERYVNTGLHPWLGFGRYNDGAIIFSKEDRYIPVTEFQDSDILTVERSINTLGETIITYKKNGVAITHPSCPNGDCSDNLGVYTTPMAVAVTNYFISEQHVPAIDVTFCTPLVFTVDYPQLYCGQGAAVGQSLRIHGSGGLELAGGGYNWEQNTGGQWLPLTADNSNTAVINNPVIGSEYTVRFTDAQGKVKSGSFNVGTKLSWGEGQGFELLPDGSIYSQPGAEIYSASTIPPNQEGWIEWIGGGYNYTVTLLDRNINSGGMGFFFWDRPDFHIYAKNGMYYYAGLHFREGDIFRIQRKKYTIDGTDHFVTELFQNGQKLPWTDELPASSALSVRATIQPGNSVPVIYSSFNLCTPLSLNSTRQTNNEGLTGFRTQLQASGGAGPYTYRWTDGFEGQDRQGLSAGTYQVKVTDKGGNSRNYSYGVGYKASWTFVRSTPNLIYYPLSNEAGQQGTTTMVKALNEIPAKKDGWVEYVNRSIIGLHFKFGLWQDTYNSWGINIQDTASKSIISEIFPIKQPVLPPLSEGDVVRVARQGSNIIISLNGQPLQSFPVDNTKPLTINAVYSSEQLPELIASEPLPAGISPSLTSLDTSPGILNNDYNYVTENTILVPVSDEAQLSSLNVFQQIQHTTYMDGLGRPIQSVITQGSPDRKDIVQPIEYDAFGRETKKYLPYVAGEGTGSYKANALGIGSMQLDFYTNTGRTDVVRDNSPFAETIYEASPLNRVIEQGAPGDLWKLNDKSGDYNNSNPSVKKLERTNRAGEVRLWTYDFASKSATSANDNTGFYPGTDANNNEGQLFVTETKDENSLLTREYKDKEGHVVSKKAQKVAGSEAPGDWIETQYIFDDFGNLRFTVQPLGVNNLSQTLSGTLYTLSADPNNTFTQSWLFVYTYDERQRIIEKQVPGGGLTCMVYDMADRLVLSQDAGQKSNNQWSFTKYDAFSRPVMSGTYTDSRDRQSIQNDINAQTGNLFETRQAGTIHGYTTAAFPSVNINIESVSYYDDYDFNNDGSESEVSYLNINNGSDITAYATDKFRARGKATGHKALILNPTSEISAKVPEGYLYTVSFYDRYGRVIQSQADNVLGGKEITSMLYDFSGKVLETRTFHNQTGSEPAKTIVNKNTYDHAGRLLKTTVQVDDENQETAGVYQYNALGQLLNKQLGNGLQKIDYAYNIRGWLGSINGDIYSGEKDLFSLSLSYQYNGNIAAQWFLNFNNRESNPWGRSFNYTYDGLNRLVKADYRNQDRFPEYFLSIYNYDDNGNITYNASYNLASITGGTKNYDVTDNLSYSYAGNRLQAVSDNSWYKKPGDALADDFARADRTVKDNVTLSSTSNTHYDYDANGSLIRDDNKDIASIRYNHLHLPEHIEWVNGNYIDNIYDATGSKLQSRTVIEGSLRKQNTYVNGFVYESTQDAVYAGDLQFFPSPEGRVLSPKAAGKQVHVYEYHYKDHLGNLRVAFRQGNTYSYSATMEDINLPVESGQWNAEYLKTRDNSQACTGSYSAKTDKNDPVGPWMTKKITKGDQLSFSARPVYFTKPSAWRNDLTNTLVRTLATGILQSKTGLSPEAGQVATFGAGLQVPVQNLLDGFVFNNQQIKAYIIYTVFDKDMHYITSDKRMVTTASQGNCAGLLELSYHANDDGYVSVMVVNESDQAVWFDDISLQIQESLVVEENNFMPWGMQMAGTEKEGTPDNRWKWNGGKTERITDLELNWDETHYRSYDMQLGRFWQVDPLPDHEGQEELTPYQFGYNNPVSHTDILGNCPKCDELLGIGVALLDNFIGLNIRGDVGYSNAANYNKGQDIGDLGSQVLSAFIIADGLIDAEAGGTLVAGSLIAEVPSGGISTAGVVGGGALVGVGLSKVAIGTIGANRSIDNYQKQKGRVNSEGITIDPANKIDRTKLNPPDKPGNAPTFKKDNKKVEIHHEGQNPNGPFSEKHPEDHRGKGNDKINHPNKSQPSKIDRNQFKKDKMEYWKKEFADFFNMKI